jgi:hypothetical protein
MEVRQVGADHDHRLRTAPETAENLRYLLRRSVADQQGHRFEAWQKHLQKRELNLERVLRSMRCIGRLDRSRRRDRRQCLAVESNGAERRPEDTDRRNSEPAKANVVGRSDQDDPLDGLGPALQADERSRGNLARVEVTRMGCDNCLGLPLLVNLGALASSRPTSARSKCGSAS